jgi:hypothetical protein
MMRSMTPKASPHPKEDRSDDHCGDASVPVGESTGEVRADRTAEEGAGYGESGQRIAEIELILNRVNGSVDDRGIEAEQEPAERAGDSQHDDFDV